MRGSGNLNVELAFWVKANRFNALVQSETRYHLSEIDIYQPDVSVVLGSTLDPKNEGKITIAPDLAVEVGSSETAERLNHKINALLNQGTRAIVVVYPSDRQILVHRSEGFERVPFYGHTTSR